MDSAHRNLIYIECSLELVHILAARTMAIQSGAKTVAPWVTSSIFLRTLDFDYI